MMKTNRQGKQTKKRRDGVAIEIGVGGVLEVMRHPLTTFT
jgi:hypothetical protein